MGTVKSEPEFLTPKELANMFQISLKAIVKWTQERRIPGQCKIGGRWRYRRLDIEKALLRGTLLHE
jgi:excisionase family DNA binding protein